MRADSDHAGAGASGSGSRIAQLIPKAKRPAPAFNHHIAS